MFYILIYIINIFLRQLTEKDNRQQTHSEMSTFAQMFEEKEEKDDGVTRTENGAVSHGSTGEGVPGILRKSGLLLLTPLLDLFFWLARGFDTASRAADILKAFQVDPKRFAKLCFQTRDIRGGKGERTLGRQMLVWLSNRLPQVFADKLVSLVPEYGRWDDLIFIAYETKSPLVKSACLKACADQLRKDKASMEKGGPTTLCAKWMPNESSAKDEKYGVYGDLCKVMDLSHRNLRKLLVSLRSYAGVIEQKMCAKAWSEIDYTKVPSQAMRLLKKAFARNDPERFQAFQDALQKGDPSVKVNAATLMPHELVKQYMSAYSGFNGKTTDPVTQAQWDALLKQYSEMGTLDGTLVVSDVSGSMTCCDGLPMQVSIALGIFVSQMQKGPWRGQVITFESNPHFHLVKDGPLHEQVRSLSGASWGGSTNIQKTFQLILGKAQEYHLPDSEMPKQVIIISDMQFDCADRDCTNLDAIREQYLRAGYPLPRLVFWNVAGRIQDVPARAVDDNIALVSGFSPSILKAVMDAKDLSLLGVLLSILDSVRYAAVDW